VAAEGLASRREVASRADLGKAMKQSAGAGMSAETSAHLPSRGPICPDSSGVQSLVPVLPGICHAAMLAPAAFSSWGGWGEMTWVILPGPFIFSSTSWLARLRQAPLITNHCSSPLRSAGRTLALQSCMEGPGRSWLSFSFWPHSWSEAG